MISLSQGLIGGVTILGGRLILTAGDYNLRMWMWAAVPVVRLYDISVRNVVKRFVNTNGHGRSMAKMKGDQFQNHGAKMSSTL